MSQENSPNNQVFAKPEDLRGNYAKEELGDVEKHIAPQH
jgi:hypothetical protein